MKSITMGPPSLFTGFLSHGKNILREAIEGGNDSGHTLYIARAFQDVSLSIIYWNRKVANLCHVIFFFRGAFVCTILLR